MDKEFDQFRFVLKEHLLFVREILAGSAKTVTGVIWLQTTGIRIKVAKVGAKTWYLSGNSEEFGHLHSCLTNSFENHSVLLKDRGNEHLLTCHTNILLRRANDLQCRLLETQTTAGLWRLLNTSTLAQAKGGWELQEK